VRFRSDEFRRAKAEAGAFDGRPPVRVGLGRLARDENPRHGNKAGRDLGRHGGWAEAAGRYRSEALPVFGLVRYDFRPRRHDADSMVPAELGYCVAEVLRAALVALDQDGGRRRPTGREEETRRTTAGSEIAEFTWWTVQRTFDHAGEPHGVLHVNVEIAGPQEPGRPRPFEGGPESRIEILGLDHSGLITTRRRGSSPSDPVTTPSNSARAS
jgi:hypothetical protein